MRTPRYFCLSIVVSCAMLCVVQAQQGKSEKSKSDNRPSMPYLLGPGDVIEVKVFGQPDLNSTPSVDSDGNLSSLPFLDPIPAKCRSERQLKKDITVAYRRLINDPQVNLRILERNSRPPASVYGAVRQSSKVTMLRKQKLNEVIAASGGFTERAAGTIQILHTEPILCPESGDEAEGLPIDGTSIPLQIVKISDLQKGLDNPIIRPGDHILVTEAEPVYFTGSVVAPGGIMLRDQLTLSRAMAMVGGARKGAKLDEVRIYRRKLGSPAEQEILKVNFEAIKNNKQLDVFLQPYDVIDVSDNGIFSGGAWLDLLIGSLMGGMRNTLAHPVW